MSQAKPIILIVSHTYCVPHNRGKLYALKKLCEGGEVHLLVPSTWPDNLQGSAYQCSSEDDQGLRVKALPVSEAGSVRRFHFNKKELKDYLNQLKPSLILGEIEPGSRALGQLFYYAKKIKPMPILNFFSWENIHDDFLSGSIFGKYKFLDKWLIRYNLKSADGAIGGNTSACEILEKANSFNGKVLECPQLGLEDTDSIQLPGFPEAEKNFNVIFSGRIVEAKGVQVLLEAIKKCPPRIHLYFLGQGSELEALKEKVTHENLSEQVFFKGSLPHKEAEDFLQTGHLLVLPSLTTESWKEQFGHVLIEAMIRGLPVIGSDSGAIPSVIEKAGLIVEEGNVDKLATAMTRLASDKKLWLKCQAKGIERVKSQYTNKSLAQKIHAYWQEQAWL